MFPRILNLKNLVFKCDELASRTSKGLSFLLLPCITPKSWQNNQFFSYSNIKEFLKKIPKNSNRIDKELQKKNLSKNSGKNTKEVPKKSQKIPQKSKDIQKKPQKSPQKFPRFWNISNSLHRTKAKNPFRLVFPCLLL